MQDAKRFLNPPAVPAVRYPRNFIKTAVCELRFPALLELEAKPPRAFQKLIRKQYPIYEPQVVDVAPGSGETLRENRYLFKSSDQQWTVSVKSFAISLETSSYIDFEDFFERFTVVLRSAEEMIDADFFIRVGLRYINKIPIEDGNVSGWIRAELLAPLMNPVLGDVTKFACLLTGSMDNGGYTVRHGTSEVGDIAALKAPKREYTLDFDFFCENLEAKAVEDKLKVFNRTNFALFSWCLGDKAKELLGPGKPKK